jgi:hypothetical protein
MRTAPDEGGAASPEQVARLVAADLKTGFPHPAGSEFVRSVLLGRVPSTRAAADRVQLVEPLLDARGYNPNGLNGFGLVETRTLFVSR